MQIIIYKIHMKQLSYLQTVVNYLKIAQLIQISINRERAQDGFVFSSTFNAM